MNRLFSITTFILFILTGCSQSSNDLDLRDYVDHWEITKTSKTYKRSSLHIDTLTKEYKVVNGHNQVFIITIERKPIFKNGKELTDLYSTKSLLIELDTADNLVTVQRPANSKIYRKLIAFSPLHGIKKLSSDEKITMKRDNKDIWVVNSKVQDFVFNGRVNFFKNQILTNKFDEY